MKPKHSSSSKIKTHLPSTGQYNGQFAAVDLDDIEAIYKKLTFASGIKAAEDDKFVECASDCDIQSGYVKY